MSVNFEKINQEIRQGKYRFLGSGSGRYVYDLDNGYVVKEARNRKGLAQNEAECRIYHHSHSDLLARIYDVSDKYAYVIMEKADKINSMTDVWKYYNVRNGHEFFHTNQFRDLYYTYNLLPNDLYRRTSWGIVNGKPLIIDYGYTSETRKYYTIF